MAPRKKQATTQSNSGRATVRDVLNAVTALNGRIDETNERVDRAIDGQARLSEQVSDVKGCITKLEKTTNERLHEMEGDITTLKRPWLLLASGWSKAVAVGGAAAAVSGTIVRLELRRFLPF